MRYEELVNAVVDNEQVDRYWEHYALFDKAGTSAGVKNNGASNDEIHVVVEDEDGLFTGTAGTVLVFGFVFSPFKL